MAPAYAVNLQSTVILRLCELFSSESRESLRSLLQEYFKGKPNTDSGLASEIYHLFVRWMVQAFHFPQDEHTWRKNRKTKPAQTPNERHPRLPLYMTKPPHKHMASLSHRSYLNPLTGTVTDIFSLFYTSVKLDSRRVFSPSSPFKRSIFLSVFCHCPCSHLTFLLKEILKGLIVNKLKNIKH